jgi:hypothetical protein
MEGTVCGSHLPYQHLTNSCTNERLWWCLACSWTLGLHRRKTSSEADCVFKGRSFLSSASLLILCSTLPKTSPHFPGLPYILSAITLLFLSVVPLTSATPIPDFHFLLIFSDHHEVRPLLPSLPSLSGLFLSPLTSHCPLKVKAVWDLPQWTPHSALSLIQLSLSNYLINKCILMT